MSGPEEDLDQGGGFLWCPHCNFQIWQTFQYAKDCLTEQDKSLTQVQKMIKICKLQG